MSLIQGPDQRHLVEFAFSVRREKDFLGKVTSGEILPPMTAVFPYAYTGYVIDISVYSDIGGVSVLAIMDGKLVGRECLQSITCGSGSRGGVRG